MRSSLAKQLEGSGRNQSRASATAVFRWVMQGIAIEKN